MRFEDWGLIDYKTALERQLSFHQRVVENPKEEGVIFCQHPPVVTLGRGARNEQNFEWQGDIVEAQRGGKATYHGPNQLVIYPIIHLGNNHGQQLPTKDVGAYLRLLENITLEVLKEIGVKAKTKPSQEISTTDPKPNYTGVWVENKKIASIGVAIKKWVTYHGIALNCTEDSQAFQGIQPCGFSPKTMTNIESQQGQKPNLEQIKSAYKTKFQSLSIISEWWH